MATDMPTERQQLLNSRANFTVMLVHTLVIGLRMGAAAKKALNITDNEITHLRAEVALPLYPPFSCLLDGIQVSTTCTIGNQRLPVQKLKNHSGKLLWLKKTEK